MRVGQGRPPYVSNNLPTYLTTICLVASLFLPRRFVLLAPRFECFIMKDLRHPNIVRLVGVCWDDFMMGCCLEYVDNGTLEYWLREDAKRKDAKNIYKTGYEEVRSDDERRTAGAKERPYTTKAQ